MSYIDLQEYLCTANLTSISILFIATINLLGVYARDFEDITVGTNSESGRNYVYVADFGNNNYNRETLQIYGFEEPDLTGLRY